MHTFQGRFSQYTNHQLHFNVSIKCKRAGQPYFRHLRKQKQSQEAFYNGDKRKIDTHFCLGVSSLLHFHCKVSQGKIWTVVSKHIHVDMCVYMYILRIFQTENSHPFEQMEYIVETKSECAHCFMNVLGRGASSFSSSSVIPINNQNATQSDDRS